MNTRTIRLTDFLNPSQMKGLPSDIQAMTFVAVKHDFPHPYVPKINQNYKFDLKTLKALIGYTNHGKGQIPWIFGPHGSGKTSVVNQLCAHFGFALREIYVGPNTETIDLCGQYFPTESGGMEFRDGVLIEAMRHGDAVLINEFDLMNPEEQKALNSVFEEREITIPQTGEKVRAADGFRLYITANTNGTGDATGNYLNVDASCSSVQDRFYFVEVDYLERGLEKELLLSEAANYCYGDEDDIQAQLDLFDSVAEVMLDYASDVRDSYRAYIGLESKAQIGLPSPLSTRSMLSWVFRYHTLTLWMEPGPNTFKEAISESLDITFIKGQKPDTQAVYQKTLTDRLGSGLVF